MLLLLLFLHQAWSDDLLQNTNFTIKKNEDCPDVGYFFRRELNRNALPGCFLCFCQSDGISFCWRREEKKCDVESYHFHNVGMKRRRPPRSPKFGDIFSKDTANSFNGKQAEGECTPYESTFSDDCPPVDWCTGCIVCDCTGDGKWECHLLSFCPDGKGKKTVKKIKENRKAVIRRRNDVISQTPALPVSSTYTRTFKLKKIMNKSVPIKVNKNQTTKHGRIPIQFKYKFRKNMTRPTFIEKYGSTTKPLVIENNRAKFVGKPDHSLDPKQMPKIVAKRVIVAVKYNKTRIIHKNQKRSIKKAVNNMNNNKASPRPKFIEKHTKKVTNAVIVMPKKINEGKRIRRDVTGNANVTTEPPVTNILKTEENATMKARSEQTISILSKDVDYRVTEALSFSNKYVVNDSFKNKTEFLNSNIKLNDLTVKSSSNYRINFTLNNTKTNLNNTEKSISIPSERNSEIKNKPDNLSLSVILTVNDLKNKRSSRIKLLNEKKNKTDLKQSSKQNIFITEKSKINRINIARKIGLPRKYNLNKVINTNKRVYDDTSTTKAVSNKINELQHIIRNLLRNFNINNTKSYVVKKERNNVLRFMKKFINKIFNKEKKKISCEHNIIFDKHHIIETLCKNFGPCKINARNRLIVKNKINELYAETINILRSVQIIKGLLRLEDIPKMEKHFKSVVKKKIRDDLQNLSIILKGEYLNNNIPLTETQIFQMEYIRNDINHLIKAISKFVETLNEIVTLLTNPDINSRVLRNTNNEDSWKSIKDLILKHNLIQNTFMEKMYEVITKSEVKDKNKCSKEVRINNSASMETYSKNIVKKLRRLKNIATLLNTRKKRQAMRDDDALEYLLMLMEYLLKKSYPLNAAPPNDGIDLLIDAIRNAPDIKPIKMNVLENTPANIISTRTEKPSVEKNKNRSQIDDVANEAFRYSDDNKELSYTEDKTPNTEEPPIKASKERVVDTKTDLPKFLLFEDFDDNDDDKYDVNRKTIETNDFVGTRKGTTSLIKQLANRLKTVRKDSHDINTYKVKKNEIYPDIDENIAIDYSVSDASNTKADVAEKPRDIDNEDKPEVRKTGDYSENIDKRARLDWIKENFDAEGVEFQVGNITAPALISTLTVKNTVETTSQSQVDISSITKELVDEEEK